MSMRTRRQEASGPGWQEHFVDKERASATVSVGCAVSESLSYVTISNFATLEEICALQESAMAFQHEAKQVGEESKGVHVLGASESNFNCTRYSVEALLNPEAKDASAALLGRVLDFLEGVGDFDYDEEMSNLALQVFGCKSSLQQLAIKWYAEPDDHGQLFSEPKVNIYEEGGLFRQHEDGMHLTLLVVLSDAFEGGGTAFYRDHKLQGGERGDDGKVSNSTSDDFVDNRKPESIATPPAGTAIIWGATLLHMALPVTKGMRSVYVGSFDLTE